MTNNNSIVHSVDTLAVIPRVSRPKNNTNSKGLLTGFLKRTIERAPIIPNDSAIFPAIIVDIT